MKQLFKNYVMIMGVIISAPISIQSIEKAAPGILLDSAYVAPDLYQQLISTEKMLKKEQHQKELSRSLEMVDFVYDQVPLKSLIEEYAQRLELNIQYPETENLTATVTFNAGRQVTLAEGWSFVKMILEQAGYTLVMKSPGVHAVVGVAKASTEVLPLYINVDVGQLPDSMERVRYIYYFKNISVSSQSAQLLPLIANFFGTTPQDVNTIMLDSSFNGVILTSRADLIKTVMQLLTVLDEGGFTQSVEIVKLQHAMAKEIVDLFSQVLGSDAAKKSAGFVSTAAVPRARYFSENVKVLNLDQDNIRHLNSIVVIGKKQEASEVIKFIKKYLDIPLESGKSFFHVVELQWLQATHLVNVLNNVIQPGSGGGAAQATGSVSSDIGFDPHIRIAAETIQQGSNAGINSQQQQNSNSSGLTNTGQRGANKIIVACSARDWDRIYSLIKQLDVPQKQVIIEALVMDLDARFVRKLGAQMRTQGIVTSIFPKNMQAQAGLLVNNILGGVGTQANPGSPDYYSLVGDLSDILNPDGVAGTGGTNSLATPNVSTSIPPPPSVPPFATSSGTGPTAFDGNTIGLISGGKNRTGGAWAFFQLLSRHNSSKIFTRPFAMALNNQKVVVTSTVTKNLAGNVVTGTSATITYNPEDATVSMQFTPLISDNDTINLQIQLDLSLWATPDDASSGTKFKRNIGTNVSLKNGDVLVLGGVMKETVEAAKRSVPFLDRIPVIGNLFSSHSKDSAKTQLYIVIRVTTVSPRTQGGMNQISRNAADFAVDQLAGSEEMFSNCKDPVTRWFFYSDRNESPSEYLENKVTDMSESDYGEHKQEVARKNPQTWHEKAAQQGGNIRIGWFSDAKSQNPVASGPANDADMQQLASLLQSIENPFEKRTNF